MSIYQEQGYENRSDYLRSIARDHGIPKSIVFEIASVYGPNEDFDGLITELEDLADSNEDFSDY